MPDFPIPGYHGRVLVADLSRGEVRVEALSPELALDYLGGRGMATRLLYDAIDPACEPLGPDNAFVIAASPLIGTSAPTAGRGHMAFKSLSALISKTAAKAFRAVGGWGYGRVDIRLDEDGQPVILEVNCNPCLDSGMGLARSAEQAGIDYPHMLQTIVKAAFDGPPYDLHLPIFNPAASGLARGR